MVRAPFSIQEELTVNHGAFALHPVGWDRNDAAALRETTHEPGRRVAGDG